MKSLGLTQKLKDFDRDFAVLAVWRKPDVIPRGLRALKGRALFVVLHRLVIDVQDQFGFFAYFALKNVDSCIGRQRVNPTARAFASFRANLPCWCGR